MDMSLDDIIRSKKISVAPTKRFPVRKPPLRKTLNRPAFKEAARITDARVKIIQKNRAKIRDARDKLAEITRNNGDVRKKLSQKQELIGAKPYKSSSFKYSRLGDGGRIGNKISIDGGGLKTRNSGYKSLSTSSLRRNDILEIPRGYVDYDNMEKMEEEEYAAATRLSRTVRNDMVYDMAPPAPRRMDSWGSSSNNDHFDPFDVYEVPHNSRHERRMSPDLPPPPAKGILRSTMRDRSPDPFQRRYANEHSSHLSYEMRSRLERAPDPHASMGIFSNPLNPPSPPNSASFGGGKSSSSGYRIVVSNLHPSVTQSDIKELFEDIGELYDSRIVRPGVAEIIYKSLANAEKAVDTYHNRQLDGQPMKCLLVNPRASNKPTAPAIRTSSSHSSNKTPLEIDIDALHKVLFRRH
uniref:RRM domain-containing protein n=1 Tax=Stomoxys calcitrans TaxID=35570 RepID=A0A1I8PU12_STOCA